MYITYYSFGNICICLFFMDRFCNFTIFFLFYIVSCGTVTVKEKNIIGIKGNNVSSAFIVTPAPNEAINILRVYISPERKKNNVVRISDNIFDVGIVPDRFKNRIHVAKVIADEYTLIISNVTYDDRSEFFCRVVFEPFKKGSLQTAISSLSEVKGMYCLKLKLHCYCCNVKLLSKT